MNEAGDGEVTGERAFGPLARLLGGMALFSSACSADLGVVDAADASDAGDLAGARVQLARLVLPVERIPPEDPTNRYADDPAAAALGKKFFFDKRFSGPLLDDANNGLPGTLGVMGETGKVACAGCHDGDGFVDKRSPRNQLSLAAGWTHRKAMSLLDVANTNFLFWDGRNGTAFSQAIGPVESPLEFNSSRLFLAQQIQRLYEAEYEAVFGPMPSLAAFPVLSAAEAGCTEMPEEDPAHTICERPGRDDDAVIRIAVNFGKAIQAFTRQLSCGRSRFDEWMDGDETALTAEEQAGAELFVGKAGCVTCHNGPYFSDQRFHNLGIPGGLVPFTGVNTAKDPGAAEGLARARKDILNSVGPYSDGDDGRLDDIPEDLSVYLGAFRTPSLRCVSRRPTFMHNGAFRSLEEVVRFFSVGLENTEGTYVGEPEFPPRNLSKEEQAQLVAFLLALDGSGPDKDLLEPPVLPD